MNDAFTRRRAGLRFVDPETERAYQGWAILEAVPFIRMACLEEDPAARPEIDVVRATLSRQESARDALTGL